MSQLHSQKEAIKWASSLAGQKDRRQASKSGGKNLNKGSERHLASFDFQSQRKLRQSSVELCDSKPGGPGFQMQFRT